MLYPKVDAIFSQEASTPARNGGQNLRSPLPQQGGIPPDTQELSPRKLAARNGTQQDVAAREVFPG